MNQPLNIPIGPTLIQYGSLKRKIVAVLFFCTVSLDNFFSLKFDPTLTSHNLGLKNYSNKNHHIFRTGRTSAFIWHPWIPLKNLCIGGMGKNAKKKYIFAHFPSPGGTAVKSNALAELMNRASKIHWKNLSLTLNGRNSETKNDKNNPKVPFFQYVQLLRNISFLLK